MSELRVRESGSVSFCLHKSGLKFLSFAIKHEEHDADSDQVHGEADQHEGTLVAREETGGGAQAEDGQNVGDVVNATRDHCGGGRATAGTHH